MLCCSLLALLHISVFCSFINFAYNYLFNFLVCCYSLCIRFTFAFAAVIKEDGTSVASAPWGLAASDLCQNRGGKTLCLNDCKRSHTTAQRRKYVSIHSYVFIFKGLSHLFHRAQFSQLMNHLQNPQKIVLLRNVMLYSSSQRNEVIIH